MNIFKKLLALTMAGVLICGAAACSSAGQGALSPEKTNRSPLRGAPSTSAGCTMRSASGTACPRCKSRHWVTGTPSARAFSGSNLPARGSSSR